MSSTELLNFPAGQPLKLEQIINSPKVAEMLTKKLQKYKFPGESNRLQLACIFWMEYIKSHDDLSIKWASINHDSPKLNHHPKHVPLEYSWTQDTETDIIQVENKAILTKPRIWCLSMFYVNIKSRISFRCCPCSWWPATLWLSGLEGWLVMESASVQLQSQEMLGEYISKYFVLPYSIYIILTHCNCVKSIIRFRVALHINARGGHLSFIRAYRYTYNGFCINQHKTVRRISTWCRTLQDLCTLLFLFGTDWFYPYLSLSFNWHRPGAITCLSVCEVTLDMGN